MTWTRFRDASPIVPNTATWTAYWFRSGKRRPTAIVQAIRGESWTAAVVVSAFCWAETGWNARKGWWAGPIPEPEEPAP